MHPLAANLTRGEHLALRAEYRRLETAEVLPEAGDFEALLTQPRVGVAWARRVAGSRLWLLYRLPEGMVALHDVTVHEPLPIDS